MSLINDALKKAQSMQSPGETGGLRLASKPLQPRAPAHPVPLGPPVSNTAPQPLATVAHRKPRTGLILAVSGGVFAGVLCLGFGAFILLWPSDAQSAVSESTVAASTATAKASAPPAADVATAEAAAAQVVAEPIPVPAAPAEPIDGATVAPVVAISEETPSAEPPASRPVMPSRPRDPRLHAFALSIRVAGIRTGDSPKALMNDRVYGIGEFVSPDHDLRLSKVDTRMLELEDSHGNIYEVRF